MSWLEKLLPSKIQHTDPADRRSVPEGLWVKCPSCETVLYKKDLEENQNVCPKCSHHHRIGARARLDAFLDAEGRYEIGQEVLPMDPLKFKDSRKYPERLKEALENTGETDALVVMGGSVHSINLVAACFEFDFMGGSMGSVVGEKVTRVFERALELDRPAVVFSASGGARMQEGVLSLMQMAKTSAARARLRPRGLPYISVVLHPTTGGVAASFAMLGDLIIAEPKALVGFAGPRVIQQTIGQELPKGFQRAEFLLEHGIVDRIISRHEIREPIGAVLRMLRGLPAKPSSSDAGPPA
jgi:acetyl-CoA carboxylase carboxyl transferase subunit beta